MFIKVPDKVYNKTNSGVLSALTFSPEQTHEV